MRIVLLLLALAAALPAAAQNLPPNLYRSGMPDVMAPAPVPIPPGDPVFNAGLFGNAYARAGRPTIAVLWNREFSDMLEQSTTMVARTDTRSFGIAGGEAVATPGRQAGYDVARSRQTTTMEVSEVRSEQARRASPTENVDFQMRSAFLNAMSSRGVLLVDRNMVMRTTSRGAQGSDAQQVETDALSKHAKLLMEVLNTPDPASPTGWATQVSIKRFSDGVLLATGYVDGRAFNTGPRRFEANPNGGGFREVAAAGPAPADLGRMAAEHALAKLGEALAR